MTDPGAIDSLRTVRDLVRYAVSRFTAAGLVYGHGTANALEEAAFIVLEALSLPIDDVNPWADARLTRRERERVLGLIEQRIATRKPAAYLLGKSYVQGIPFIVDERVIVPRSYIGELLAGPDPVIGEDALLGPPEAISKVLDLCTGSGCLAVIAARVFPDAMVDAADISRDALEVARANVALHGLERRIRLVEGDLFQPLAGRRYDLILANPPYVAAAEVDAFAPEHAAEPALAHLGGADGLDIVGRILAGAAAHLAEGGSLMCEVGTGRARIEAAFPDLDPVWLDTAESEGEVLWLDRSGLPSA